MRIKAELHSLIFMMVGIILLQACGEKKSVKSTPAPQRPQPVAAATVPDDETKEKPVYVYSGERFKDPFMELGQSTSYSPDAIFNPNQAKVKAIIYSPRIRSAVLQVSGSGSYFIKGGRIFDVMGKTMKGFRAKVFIDKVIISGETDDVFELKIRETEDEGENT